MIKILDNKPEVQIPFLYEVWNWVGDTSILPIKWYELLKKHDGLCKSNIFSAFTREYLLNTYVRNPNFDPNAFFFLTTRSEVVSGVLVWPLNDSTCEFVTVAALPTHRNKQVLEALLSLAVGYAIDKGFTQAVYNEHE
jgi:hypothetical protein